MRPHLVPDLAPARPKLRILYSTACYGLSHAQPFVDAGFDAACGAIGSVRERPGRVPAGPVDVVPRPHVQGRGEQGRRPLDRGIFDAAAWLSGFHDANSDKEIKGDLTITIDGTPP